jgi:dTDP-4-amino-4,6-dideoxygalactose transaminase
LIDSDRDGLVQHLQNQGIPCGVYYPIPLHAQKAYRSDKYDEENFAVTNQLVKEVISLPMHSELDAEQIEMVCQAVLDFLG